MMFLVGLFIGVLSGILIGVELATRWTHPAAKKELIQRSFEHTVGHPGDLP